MKNNNNVNYPIALEIVRRYFPGVTSVADSAKGVTIEVTDNDNRSATPLDHRVCALAVACKRSLKADGVIVGTRTAYIIHGRKAIRYRLLESTAREIVSFDRGAGYYSGLYRLNAPCKSDRLGEPRHGKRSNKTDRKVRMRHITANIRTMLGHGVTAK